MPIDDMLCAIEIVEVRLGDATVMLKLGEADRRLVALMRYSMPRDTTDERIVAFALRYGLEQMLADYSKVSVKSMAKVVAKSFGAE